MTATKHDQNKLPMHLIPVPAMQGLAQVLEYGQHKYTSWNWAQGMDWSRLYGAALRHLTSHMNGEDKDPESGLSHLDHAMCCLVFLSTYEKCRIGRDDRYPLPVPKPNEPTFSLNTETSHSTSYNPDKYWKGECTRTINGYTLRYHPESGYEYITCKSNEVK